jgi:hypothetical protein
MSLLDSMRFFQGRSEETLFSFVSGKAIGRRAAGRSV